MARRGLSGMQRMAGRNSLRGIASGGGGGIGTLIIGLFLLAVAIQVWYIVIPGLIIYAIYRYLSDSSQKPVATVYMDGDDKNGALVNAPLLRTADVTVLLSTVPPPGCTIGSLSNEIPPAAAEGALGCINSGFAVLDTAESKSVGRLAIFVYPNRSDASSAYAVMLSNFMERFIRKPHSAIVGIGDKCEANVYHGQHALFVTSLIQHHNLVINAVFPSKGDYEEYLLKLTNTLGNTESASNNDQS